MKIESRHYTYSDEIRNSRIYNEFLQIGFDDGWSRNDKWDNFRMLMDICRFTDTPIQGTTVLDVGCGTGDLVQFLADKNIKEYVGIDIFEPAVAKAREKFPDEKFIVKDFLRHRFRKKFDFVFCSGALTTNLASNNYDMITLAIRKMWRLAKKGVGFNFLMGEGSGGNTLFLYDPARVIATCKALAPQAKIATITTSAGSGKEIQEMHVFLF